MSKINLTELEQKIFNEVSECCEMAMQTNDIRKHISETFNLSSRQSSGHLGKLAEKGYIKSETYTDKNIGKITQFIIL